MVASRTQTLAMRSINRDPQGKKPTASASESSAERTGADGGDRRPLQHRERDPEKRRPVLKRSCSNEIDIGTSSMADIALQPRVAKPQIREATTWDLIRTNKNWLGFWFMMPAMGFLIFFLAYPLGLRIWISFTDAKIGRPGAFIGIEHYECVWSDSFFWLLVIMSLLYTFIASA